MFIVCPTSYSRWQLGARNAERHVDSGGFFERYGRGVCEQGCFVAFSPRFILDGREGRFVKWLVLRLLMLRCSYVYVVDGCMEDAGCRRLVRFDRMTFRRFVGEGVER